MEKEFLIETGRVDCNGVIVDINSVIIEKDSVHIVHNNEIVGSANIYKKNNMIFAKTKDGLEKFLHLKPSVCGTANPDDIEIKNGKKYLKNLNITHIVLRSFVTDKTIKSLKKQIGRGKDGYNRT